MKGFAAVRLVAGREVGERVKQRSFVISTGITAAIIVLLAFLPKLLGDDGPTTYQVGFVGVESQEMSELLGDAPPGAGVRLDRVTLPDQGEARRLVVTGRLDAAVVDGSMIVVDEEVPDRLRALLEAASGERQARAALVDAGVPAGQADRILRPEPLAVDVMSPGDDERDRRAQLVQFGMILLYSQLIGYGFWVASGLVEERASRVVEVLLAKVEPRPFLAGKVAGLGALGLLQLVAFIGIGLAAVSSAGTIDLPSGIARVAVEVLAWFVLGYGFYACLFATAGALASRQEELQNTTAPLTILLAAGFIFSFAASEDPDSTLATVVSLLPPSAPLVMPHRLAQGAAAPWEAVLAVALALGSMWLLMGLAARIYSGAALRSRGAVKFADAWRGGSS